MLDKEEVVTVDIVVTADKTDQDDEGFRVLGFLEEATN